MTIRISKMCTGAVLFITCLFFSVEHVQASTTVSADLTTDATWNLSGSPYVLTKQIKIPAGVTLTIEPGVTVTHTGDFRQYYNESGIIVRGGKLLVQGGDNAPVCITDFTIGVEAHGTADIVNAEVLAVVASQSDVTLRKMTLGTLVASGSSSVIANGISITGLSAYPTTISSNSVLTMEGGSIANPNSGVQQAISFLGANGTLHGTTISSVTDGIRMSLTVGHSVTLQNAVVRDSGRVGVHLVKDPATSFDNTVLYLLDSEIAGNAVGIQSDGRPTIVTNQNSIHDNGAGVIHTGTSSLSFVANWWGDKTGPYNAVSNPNGKGNSVTDNIAIFPWLGIAPFPPQVIKVIEPVPEPDPAPEPEPIPEPVPEPEPQPAPEPAPVPAEEPGAESDPDDDVLEEIPPVTNPPPAPEPPADDPQPLPDDIPASSGGGQLPPPRPRSLRTPVLIVPGLLGTELGTDETVLWLDLDRALGDFGDRFMEPLKFTSTLLPSDVRVGIRHIIGTKMALGGLATLDYTSSLIQELEARGYTLEQDLFDFPYDWRFGASADIARQLADRIGYIKSSTGAEKVDVIAHSMGGLVVKRYIWEHPTGSAIGKAIFVGVPDLGAPKVLKVLLEGDTFGIPFLNDARMREIAINMPALYDLAPSTAYVEAAGSYFRVVTQGFERIVQALGKSQTEERLVTMYGANPAAVQRAEYLHDSMLDGYDVRTAGIDAYSIVGCKTGTFGGLSEIVTSRALGGISLGFRDVKEVSGDGTVPLASALHLAVDAGHRSFVAGADHARMLGDASVRTRIGEILVGGNENPSSGIMSDTSGCGLTGHLVSVYAPLSLGVTDAQGRHAGDAIEDTQTPLIQGADFHLLGGSRFIFLPTDAGQEYDISLTGIADGTLHIVDEVMRDGEVIATQFFDEGVVKIGTQAKLILGEPSTLTIEERRVGQVSPAVVENVLKSDADSKTSVAVLAMTPTDIPPTTPPTDHQIVAAGDVIEAETLAETPPQNDVSNVATELPQESPKRPRFGLVTACTLLALLLSLIARHWYMRYES